MSKDEKIKTTESASTAPPSAEELLSFISDNGMVDLGDVKDKMVQSRKQQVLDKYIHKIGKLNGKTDKRYYIRIKDSSKKDGRTTLKAPTKDELLEKIYEWHVNHIEDNNQPSYENTTLLDIFDEFVQHKLKTTWSEATLKRNMSTWNNYYKDSEIINIPICQLRILDFEEWAYGLIRDNNLTLKEYRNIATWMKQMMTYAERREIINKNYFNLLCIENKNVYRQPKEKISEEMVLNPEDEILLYQECMRLYYTNHYPKHKNVPLAIILLFQTGCRPCEICALKYSDITESGLIISRLYSEEEGRIKDEHTKAGHGSRPIPVTPLAKEIIHLTLADRTNANEDDYVLAECEDNIKGLYNRLRKTLPLMCKRLNIYEHSPYAGRRTYASSLVDADVNVKLIQLLLGHNTPQMLFNHYNFNRSKREEEDKVIINARLGLSLEDIVPTVPKSETK